MDGDGMRGEMRGTEARRWGQQASRSASTCGVLA